MLVSGLLCGSLVCFCFQAEDGIRDLVRSRGLGDVYKRQVLASGSASAGIRRSARFPTRSSSTPQSRARTRSPCLLYTSDAADERSSVDLGGRRLIKKKKRYITE